jgi:thymidylate synthase
MYLLNDYDESLKRILKEGVRKKNRTGIDCLTLFCMQARYRIDEYFPLLTKRKMGTNCFGELLWFVSGSTNNKDLQKNGVEYWTPWVDPNFEKKHGYAEGSLGPVYGFQLRHFNGYYGNGNTIQKHLGENIYGRGGSDQLLWMVDQLKTNPDSRRNLFSLWNPMQNDFMRLPPCHYTFQVFVHEDKLSGVLTQRSCDFPVGVPYDIAIYSGLIYMLAQQTGYYPYEFVHHTIDSHIYVNQIEAVEEYLSRPEIDCPKLNLKKAKDIDSYSIADFEIIDYNPGSTIKIPVAV